MLRETSQKSMSGTHRSANRPQTTNDTAAPTHSPHTFVAEPPFWVYASLAPINQNECPSQQWPNLTLKSAVATVGHNLTHCEANILFDEGAQGSFII